MLSIVKYNTEQTNDKIIKYLDVQHLEYLNNELATVLFLLTPQKLQCCISIAIDSRFTQI